jgi:hypothetical protein
MREPNVETYILMTGTEEETIEGREAAVAKAKEISRATGNRVMLERADGRVTMQFEKGSLEAFSAETRDRGGRDED